MITQVFKFGDYSNDIDPVIGGSNSTQYAIGMALLLIVVVLIPIMMCTKPIVHGCFQDHAEEERDMIEFTNINRGDDMQQPLQPRIQRESYELAPGEDSSRKTTDDMMMKRQREMQSLDA
jgi:hypothetical protein